MLLNTWGIICVLFLLLPCIISERCTINETLTDNVSCFCDPLDRYRGWTYTCIDVDAPIFENLYNVKYSPGKVVAFDCIERDPDFQTILRQIELDQIQSYSFKSCSLPNVSFSEIIPYQDSYPVQHIVIEHKRDDKPFTASLFGNLSSSLISLNLPLNKIESLPESLFSNFSRLQYLSLSDNRLTSLPESLFLNLTTLLTLEVTNNVLESLPESVFDNLSLLEKLYLYKNKLRGLPDGIFKNLSNLKVLDLGDNNLMQLPDNIFNGLSNLIHIRLRANWLLTLSKDLFLSCSNLKDIDLSLNKFMEPLDGGLFFGLTQLEKVSIQDCNLTEIHENFFAYNPNLTVIDLMRNSLSRLPNRIFHNNSMLKEINLNFNHLEELPLDLFPDQMRLEKLSIFKNNLSIMPDGLFKKARKIKTLVLGGNQIRNASETIFRDLPDLEFLDLSVNKLTYFQLDNNEYIKHIDLSYNRLDKLPGINWIRYLQLEWVSFEHNQISYLKIPVLALSQSGYLNFANNNIKFVDISEAVTSDMSYNDDPEAYNTLIDTKVVLTSNPFDCNCKLYEFYDYITQNPKLRKKSLRVDAINNLTCKEPRNLAGKPIISLMPDYFTCDIQEQCSHPCHCYFRAKDQSAIMNCSHHKMSVLPSTVPYNTTVLFFEDNTLTNISGFNDEIWENLTDLFLDHNQITDLDHWKIPVNLKNISLRGNLIKHLPPTLMTFISNNPNVEITLHDNPFHCNCSTRSFKKWLTEHYTNVKDVSELMCANPLKLNGTSTHMPILSTPDDLLCPLDDWPYKLHLISVTVICIVLALLLFVVSVLYYRNKQTVIAYVYIHMHQVFTCFFSEEEMDEDKVFDAFVSYSSSDRDIALTLIDELEPLFRLCIHERNWIAGNPISWSIINSVHNSKRTILIISKEFLQSMWFQVEFHTAYYQMLEDKIDRLIIIVKGELPPKDTLDKDLQYLLSTKTYLMWEEKWFWEKLKYALPHKKQLPPNDVLALRDRPASEKVQSVDSQIAVLSAKSGKELLQLNTMNLIKK